MSLINSKFCPFVEQKTVCKICEGTSGAMESIFCRESDDALLDKIHKCTGVRVRPVCGMISPVCEFCHARINQFDETFKPRCKEYVVEKVTSAALDPEDDPFNCAEPEPPGLSIEEADKGELKSDQVREVSIPEIVAKVDEPCGQVSPKEEMGLSELTELLEKAEQGESEDGFPLEEEIGDWDDMEPPPVERKRRKRAPAAEQLSVRKAPTKCEICGKLVTYMKDHMRMHSEERRFKCPHCDRTFGQSSNLIYHVRTHTGEKPFACDKCDKSFICKSHLLSHARSHVNDQPFQCEVCSKRFNQACNLTKHLRLHSGEKPYQCSICAKAFMNLSNKKTHEKRHRGERNFTCEICSKSFYDNHHLERHVGTHSTEKRFKCAHCPKQFSSESAWRSHEPKHNSTPKEELRKSKPADRKHKCESCPRSFTQLVQLEKHRHRGHGTSKQTKKTRLVIIDPERAGKQLAEKLYAPFRCSVCNQVFSKANGLKAHLSTHMGDGWKAFQCDKCPRAFSQQDNLQAHERRHAGEKPYRCVPCGANFASVRALKQHRLASHGRDILPDSNMVKMADEAQEPTLVQLMPMETAPEAGQVVATFELQNVDGQARLEKRS